MSERMTEAEKRRTGPTSIATLARRALQLLGRHERIIIGITGCPGAGKSTAAEALVGELCRSVKATSVPMDGFHLANAELVRLGRVARKGAIDTFDAYGYLTALRTLRTERLRTVYTPAFSRVFDESIGSAIPVEPTCRIILTEGNYLLDEDQPWPHVRNELAEVWYVDIDEDLRRTRLLERHVRFGKSRDEALHWVHSVDDLNAARIVAARPRADMVIDEDR